MGSSPSVDPKPPFWRLVINDHLPSISFFSSKALLVSWGVDLYVLTLSSSLTVST